MANLITDQPKLIKRSGSTVIPRLNINKDCAQSSRSTPGKLNNLDRNKLREEAFQNWLQTKKQQQLRKREEEKRVKQITKEQEQIKKEAAVLSFTLWKHKKDQMKKANQLKESQMKEEEYYQKQLKQQISRERVNQWMHSSKYKPRPVPSNLGLLSLTATNPPSFFNPHPWVYPV